MQKITITLDPNFPHIHFSDSFSQTSPQRLSEIHRQIESVFNIEFTSNWGLLAK
jgi:hypothetical protein